jgi:hypothetical protein
MIPPFQIHDLCSVLEFLQIGLILHPLAPVQPGELQRPGLQFWQCTEPYLSCIMTTCFDNCRSTVENLTYE